MSALALRPSWIVAPLLALLLVECSSERERIAERIATTRANVDLPALASGAVRIEEKKTQMAVRFSVVGATADVILDVLEDGVEDSIRYPTRPAREATVYEVDVEGVAGLRLVSNVLEFLDGGGAPRLRMGAPFVVDAKGAKRDAKVAVRGCATDTDPRPPWGRSVVPPGAARCEVEVSWAHLGGAYPLTVDPAWTTTGRMSQLHGFHEAVTLPSKKVLIVGGNYGGYATEIFDPVTETWAVSQSTPEARFRPGAVLLDSGDVMLIGGTSTASLNSTLLYNETRGTWIDGPPMAKARAAMATAKLPNGAVLVAGGRGVADAELYDPTANAWVPAGTMSTDRWAPVSSLLPDGSVLVAGGESAAFEPMDSAEIFTPPATWTPVPPMASVRTYHRAVALDDGRVLVAAGAADAALTQQLDTAELFDPAMKTWSPAGTFTTARTAPSLVRLASGRVLLAGGDATRELASAELYDPKTNRWMSAGYMNARRDEHTATLLSTGKVLIAGPDVLLTELYEAQKPGGPCVSDGECEAGFCVDGICCDTPCHDSCTACTAAKKGGGVDGVCGPMPAGVTDPGCPSLPASTCGATGTCDGRGACALQASGAACGPAVCERDVLTATTCNGRGVCEQTISPCAPYACDGAAACRHAPCASDGDCADTFSCGGQGSCAPPGCDGDHVILGADRVRHDCAPYRCATEGCKTQCRSSADCAAPAVCNSSHGCVLPDEARRGGGDGGCAVALTPGIHDRGAGWWRAFASLFLMFVFRRVGRRVR